MKSKPLLTAIFSFFIFFPEISVSETKSLEKATADKVMIILDASGSMWGQVQGKAKIDVAKSAVKELVKDWDEGVELGLMAYGHRRKGDCSDIETLVGIRMVNAQDFASSVDALSPKGKTPLSDAVIRAAEELKYSEDKATVILVSDGIESCKKDPCKVAEELEKKGVDFTAHIVGFDIKKEDQAKLRCIAENTGGSYFDAKDASSLQAALKGAVQKAVDSTGVTLSAVMVEGGEPLDGVVWGVFEPEADFEGKRKRVARSYDKTPVLNLPPGTYRVEVTRGDARASKEIEIVADKSAHEVVVLGSGDVALTAHETDGGAMMRGVVWKVFEPAVDFDGKRKSVATSYDHNPTFSLRAGTYVVQARKGSVTAEKELDVVAGKKQTAKLVMGSGKVKFRAFLHEGSEVIQKGLSWKVFLDTGEGFDEKPKRVAQVYTAQPVIPLMVGKYVVEVKSGASVSSGFSDSRRARDHVADRCGALLSEAREPIKVDSFKVFQKEQDERETNLKVVATAYSSNPQPLFTLSAGDYIVSAKLGYAEVKKEITIEPGDKKQETLVLHAGMVKLSAVVEPGGDPVKKVTWRLFKETKDDTEQRKQFLSSRYSFKQTPLIPLPPGNYLVTVKSGEKNGGESFAVTAGEKKHLEIVLD